MFITALCPTFRHPKQLAQSLWHWNNQDYPEDQRHLVILDSGQTFYNQHGTNWTLYSYGKRPPSLPAKYNELLKLAPAHTDAFLVWEDDDIYLPSYISKHAEALKIGNFSKPGVVVSDYTKELKVEKAAGRFHSTLGFKTELIHDIGGWPETKRADFDQQLISRLQARCDQCVSPWPDDTPLDQIPFIYRWHTGVAHCQSTMRSPDDETWYDRGEQAYKEVPYVGSLRPEGPPWIWSEKDQRWKFDFDLPI